MKTIMRLAILCALLLCVPTLSHAAWVYTQAGSYSDMVYANSVTMLDEYEIFCMGGSPWTRLDFYAPSGWVGWTSASGYDQASAVFGISPNQPGQYGGVGSHYITTFDNAYYLGQT